MLLTDITTEARALIQYAEVDGADPEATAVLWIEATLSEARAVVREAQKRGLSTTSEWAGDFLSAHRWFREHPDHPETRAAVRYAGL
jgi:hypothetical protein